MASKKKVVKAGYLVKSPPQEKLMAVSRIRESVLRALSVLVQISVVTAGKSISPSAVLNSNPLAC